MTNNQGFMASIERATRRIIFSINRGLKRSGDDSGTMQKLQIQLGADEIRDNTPRLIEFGFASMPPDGSDLVVLFAGGNKSAGVVIASGHIPSRPRNLLPGESKLYSQDGKYIYMTAADGITIDAKGQPVTINNASTVTVNASGDVTVNSASKATITAPLITLNAANIAMGGMSGASAAEVLKGDFTLQGSLTVTGNIGASDTILDGSGNTNHHTH